MHIYVPCIYICGSTLLDLFYVYIYKQVCINIYSCTYRCHVYICVGLHSWTGSIIYRHIRAYKLYTCVHVLCVCVCVCLCVSMCVCMSVYVHVGV